VSRNGKSEVAPPSVGIPSLSHSEDDEGEAAPETVNPEEDSDEHDGLDGF
jgi:hypothetical protein